MTALLLRVIRGLTHMYNRPGQTHRTVTSLFSMLMGGATCAQYSDTGGSGHRAQGGKQDATVTTLLPFLCWVWQQQHPQCCGPPQLLLNMERNEKFRKGAAVSRYVTQAQPWNRNSKHRRMLRVLQCLYMPCLTQGHIPLGSFALTGG